MTTDLQKLISEYCAIEKMDRAVQQAYSVDEIDLIGFTVRAKRRREILRELAACLIVAEVTSSISCIWGNEPLPYRVHFVTRGGAA